MFRGSLARSSLALVSALCVASISFAPLAALGQTNIGEIFNLQCNGHNSGGACGGPFPGIPGSAVAGKCDGSKVCQVTTYTSPAGMTMPIADAPTAVSNAFNPGLFTQAGNLVSAHPIISMLGISAGVSLLSVGLSSLLAPGAQSQGSGGSYTGGCTTQYYYTTDPSALTDPCAIYSTNTGTPGVSTTSSVSDLLNALNASSSPSDGTTPSETPISDVLTSNLYYDNTTGSATPSQTPLSQNSVPAPANGLEGNISTLGGGVTIYATSRSDTSETAGFFGSNSIAGQLCQSRPWASNFLSYIIPPTFFDNLCSWAGYPAGSQQSPLVSTGSSATNASQNVSVPAPQQSQPSYNSTAQPSATIWARPPYVSLGGRTNIFWVSQNVSSCTESSSDGNFTGSSTSGGASTVALSGPVTFTIKCLGLDGSTVSNSTTVTIGS